MASPRLVLAGLVVAAVVGTPLACGPGSVIWACFDPGTGHLGTYYDGNHYVNGVFDPCHCYDPCPADTCPILVDAGPLCDGGSEVVDAGSDGS